MAVLPTTDVLQEALALHRRGAVAEAAARYAAVLRADPANADAHYYLAMIACQQGRFEEGAVLARRSLAADPHHARAHVLLARALSALERHEEALENLDRALALAPELAQAHGNRGDVLSALGRNAEAIDSYDRAVALAPDSVEDWFNRGLALIAVGRHAQAIASFDAAIAGRPDFAQAQLWRGRVLLQLARPDEALAAADRVLALAPDDVDALILRGDAWRGLNDPQGALASFDRALAVAPDRAEAWLGRGNVLSELARYEDASPAYDRALALKPGLAEAWLGRGNVLTEFKRHEEALAAYDKAATLKPALNYAAGARLFAKLLLCDWTALDAQVAELLSAIRERSTTALPFSILAVPSSAADQLQCAANYVRHQPAFPPIWRGEVFSHDRIRLAYLSADFHDSATAALLAGLFERHDRSRFETTAISFGPDRDSPMRQRLQGAFEHFIDVRNDSEQGIAELMRRLEIDIAVDLMGFTKHNRLNVLARRPAPIQVNYLGYPGTTGAGYIDYILADATVIPEDQCGFYAEQVVWLPDTYFVNDNTLAVSERTPSRRDCGLPDTGFVFCCFNNTYKIMPEIFDVWMKLLPATEGSVLWLVEADAATSANLRREAQSRGVAPARLIFAPRVSLADHLARQRLADLFLDTLPYNAHTMASDALWVGLPMLTCLGTTFAGRVAASLLKAIGLDELIARSLPEYQALALELAHDPARLASLKGRLARNRDSCALFDTARATRAFEAAYRMMWERQRSGEARPAGSRPIRVG